MNSRHPDDILVWPDGSWWYRCEWVEGDADWKGDDFYVLFCDTPEWNDFIDTEISFLCQSTNSEK